MFFGDPESLKAGTSLVKGELAGFITIQTPAVAD
jgi:hypothetical protein